MSLILTLSILSALVSSFIILVAKKVGVVEWVQLRGAKPLTKLFGCDLCLSFWVNVLLIVPLSIILSLNIVVLIIPILATPITRYLL